MSNRALLLTGLFLLFFVPLLYISIAIAPSPSTRLQDEFRMGRPLPQPAFKLHHAGEPLPLDMEKYGTYVNPGTKKFSFKPSDMPTLQNAMPQGIYPNQKAVFNDPAYKELRQKGALGLNHWKALEAGDLQSAFFIWASAPEPEGVKLFFMGILLERAGHVVPAMHAYQSLISFHPKSVVYSKDGSFVWYPAEAAMASLRRLCNEYPVLGLEYRGGDIIIENGGDAKLSDDTFTVTPGKFVKKSGALPGLGSKLRSLKTVEKRGRGKVQLLKDANGHWKMRVDNKPYEVRGVCYSATRIGLGPKSDPHGFSYRWMFSDLNNNGKIDAPYDSWVDANENGVQDADEPAIGDFELLRRMGCNTVKIFHMPSADHQYTRDTINVPLLRDLYETYGIRVIMGDFIGAYTVGSGAEWETGTDYRDPVQRERMKRIVRDMVLDLKNEPFILMWSLGNENNMNPVNTGVNATRTNAGAYPEVYAKFLNELAEMIHEIDPDHPVAVGNLETGLLDIYAKYAPALDVLGINSYRGASGFGSLWLNAKRLFDRPVLILEYGCDAYHEGQGENQDEQLAYLEGSIRDIVLNQAGGPGAGNALGGCIFQYADEWWKDTHSKDPEDSHQTRFSGNMPFPDGYNHEEWFGIVSQGSGAHSPFERRPRKAYDYFRKIWGSETA